MIITPSEVKEKIIMAYKILLKNDHYLLEKNTNIRTINHKFAEYLQMLFPEYNVDCEYNVKFKNPDELLPWDEISEAIAQKFKESELDKYQIVQKLFTESISNYPNIIIHKRGTDNNLVVIQTKKLPSSLIAPISETEKVEKFGIGLGFKNLYVVSFPVADELALYQDDNLSSYIEVFQV
jgi:hypothetical protein